LEGLQNQTTGLLGELATSLKDVFVPALQTTSNAINSVSQWVRGDGTGTAGRAGVVAAGGVGAAAAAGLAARMLLNPFTTANTQLTTAGVQLQAAAAALSRSAVVQGAGGAIGAGGRATPPTKSAAVGIASSLFHAVALASALGHLTTAVQDTVSWFNMNAKEREDHAQKQFTEMQSNNDKLNTLSNSFFNAILPRWMSDRLNGGKGTGVSGGPGRGEEGAVPGTFDKKGVNTSETKAYVQQLTTEISALTEQIKSNVDKEKLPGTADAANAGLLAQRQALGEEITRLTGVPTLFDTTFATGAASLKQVGPAIDQAASAFGPTAGQGIMPYASQFGAAAGAALAAAANGLNITLKAPPVAANTGTTSTAN
jgi:hypothetical protein